MRLPYSAKTCRNSKIKCDFNDVLGNLNMIVMTFKINIYVALEKETNRQVIYLFTCGLGCYVGSQTNIDT
jgi:hypothetical protein